MANLWSDHANLTSPTRIEADASWATDWKSELHAAALARLGTMLHAELIGACYRQAYQTAEEAHMHRLAVIAAAQ